MTRLEPEMPLRQRRLNELRNLTSKGPTTIHKVLEGGLKIQIDVGIDENQTISIAVELERETLNETLNEKTEYNLKIEPDDTIVYDVSEGFTPSENWDTHWIVIVLEHYARNR